MTHPDALAIVREIEAAELVAAVEKWAQDQYEEEQDESE